MKPQEMEMVRSLLASLMHTAAALDQIINPEPEPEPRKKAPPRTMGDDTTTED